MLSQLSTLTKVAVGDATLGFIYGCLSKANPKVAACAFVIIGLAEDLLAKISSTEDVRSYKIYTVNSTIFEVVSIVTLQKLDVIATKGIIFLTVLELYVLAARYFEFQEMS